MIKTVRTVGFYFVLILCFTFSVVYQSVCQPKTPLTQQKWKLIFEDNFNTTGKFDDLKWSYCEKFQAPWARYLTASTDNVFVDGRNLRLTMTKKYESESKVTYYSGGIQTKGKFSFTYGKVQVRAKFTGGRGSWPAIWMMPELPHAYGNWPKSGEIDIMEHVNNEKVIHQSIHNARVTSTNGESKATKASIYDPTAYHIYGIEWSEDRIDFYLNNEIKYTYHKPANATPEVWPFDQPFYLILNQSGGAGWPGPITNTDLPFNMQVDWVKVYQLK